MDNIKYNLYYMRLFLLNNDLNIMIDIVLKEQDLSDIDKFVLLISTCNLTSSYKFISEIIQNILRIIG